MFISIPGCLLLSISSVLTRPDVSHLGESQKLDNQYATLDAGDGGGRVEGRGAAAASLSNQETREEVSEGVPEWLSIEKSHLATEQDNGNGMLHNYGNENGLLTIRIVGLFLDWSVTIPDGFN